MAGNIIRPYIKSGIVHLKNELLRFWWTVSISIRFEIVSPGFEVIDCTVPLFSNPHHEEERVGDSIWNSGVKGTNLFVGDTSECLILKFLDCPSFLPESSRDEESLEHLSLLAEAWRFTTIHFHISKVAFFNYVPRFRFSSGQEAPVLLSSMRIVIPRKRKSRSKNWIPDQVRNDTTCKVISETLPGESGLGQ